MPPLLDVDGVAKKCDRIVLQGTQEVLKVRHDENEVTFTSNNLHTDFTAGTAVTTILYSQHRKKSHRLCASQKLLAAKK